MAQDMTGWQDAMQAMEKRLTGAIAGVIEAVSAVDHKVDEVDRKLTYVIDNFLNPKEAIRLKSAGGSR